MMEEIATFSGTCTLTRWGFMSCCFSFSPVRGTCIHGPTRCASVIPDPETPVRLWIVCPGRACSWKLVSCPGGGSKVLEPSLVFPQLSNGPSRPGKWVLTSSLSHWRSLWHISAMKLGGSSQNFCRFPHASTSELCTPHPLSGVPPSPSCLCSCPVHLPSGNLFWMWPLRSPAEKTGRREASEVKVYIFPSTHRVFSSWL